MSNIKLDQFNRFILDDYQQKKPFASFLPGIAGPLGIPMWAFYVNRGQAISSFGVESKDSPILEFQPANKAYQMTPYTGFRTFLKVTRGTETRLYEPFSPGSRGRHSTQQMAIGANELEIEEIDFPGGLKVTVLYYTLPGEVFAGLARRVRIQNLAERSVALEIVDGIPAVIPYGVNNFLLKELGRTVEAWMEVFNLEANIPFYRLRASVVDKVEVETFKAGHFALAFVGQKLLPALIDPAVVFDADTSFTRPEGFYRQALEAMLLQPQVTCGRTPCGLFAHQVALAPSESVTLYSLYGHISSLETLQRHLPRLMQASYFDGKYHEAVNLANDLTDAVLTQTSDSVFDAYCRQNFLDNVLRGGWPVLLGEVETPHIYPIYSRKHGDLERDYNAFFIAPEPFSQGEGSYRDVIQNRRDNVWLNPRVGNFDIRTFMSLIQSDGYNPRIVKGSTFTLSIENQAEALAGLSQPEKLRATLAKPFTPGSLLKYIADNEIELSVPPDEFLSSILCKAEQHLEASFFEGYWIDHWEYNLDLIESYLTLYPDLQDQLLFGQADLPFFDSPVFVQPRSKKYVLANGIPRQIGSLIEDEEKAALIASRTHMPNWTRMQHGRGEVYRATLFAKLALTALLKFATLDSWGMGIEMEASRPGWYDALNGLPALFGSGIAETFELQRWLVFLRATIQMHGKGEILLPVEAADLLHKVIHYLETYNQTTDAGRDFRYWEAVSTARETYRELTRLGIDGAEQAISLAELDAALAAFQRKVTTGIARALNLNDGFPPTYFTFKVDEYEVLPEADSQGRPIIHVSRFTPNVLPPFLEGPVRAYKTLPDVESARKLYHRVKNSPLFDRQLKMYKVNASLEDQPHDIGRARAFPPGWLENESIWLHMEYKYLLETLKSGLFEEFFEDFHNTLVPFLDPQVYGRSPLENSSFLVSSAHPDLSLHGTGFVARLSGSTAEFQSMWSIMMAGRRPFYMQDGQLCLALQPVLPSWLFTDPGEVAFRFLGCCKVTYHNPQRLDTYIEGVRPQRIALYELGGKHHLIQGGVIGAPYARWVREGKVERIEVYF